MQSGRWVLKEWWHKAQALGESFSKIDAGTHASSIAYFTFLSLIPVITLCISLVSMVGIGEPEITEFFASLVPDSFNEFATSLVDDAFKRSGVAFSLSTLTLLWTASQGIRALRTGLNVAYGTRETRNIVVVVLISVLAVAILGVLLATTMYLVFGGPVMRFIAGFVPGLEQQGDVMNVLNAAVMLAVGIVALGACYTYLPDGSRRFVAQLPGAVLAASACGVLVFGFHVYVDNFCNFEALYGSIATVALFLFWIYLVAFIIIAGAFLNRTLANRRQGGGEGSERDSEQGAPQDGEQGAQQESEQGGD